MLFSYDFYKRLCCDEVLLIISIKAYHREKQKLTETSKFFISILAITFNYSDCLNSIK